MRIIIAGDDGERSEMDVDADEIREMTAKEFITELRDGNKKKVVMLSDIERKVLRILYNETHAGGCVPSINKLVTRTGKPRGVVLKVLQTLAEKGYIDWSLDRHGDLQVIKAWEDHQAPVLSKPQLTSEYWDRGY